MRVVIVVSKKTITPMGASCGRCVDVAWVMVVPCRLNPGVDAIALDWLHTSMYNTDNERLLNDPSVERVLARQRQQEANQKNGLHLHDCLDEFTRAEVLADEESWKCEKCKVRTALFVCLSLAMTSRACLQAPRRGLKTIALWTLPDMLVIHLKRMYYSRYFQKKLNAFVKFPLEGLDLDPWCAKAELTPMKLNDGDEGNLYDLYAVVNHSGHLGAGKCLGVATLCVLCVWCCHG